MNLLSNIWAFLSGLGATVPGAVAQGLLWAVMTIGVFITYRILDMADLTVEGSITLGGAIAGRLITLDPAAMQGAGQFALFLAKVFSNPFAATLIAMLGGMAAGLVTALLHTKLKIPALLSGILTMIALYSVNIRVMGKANISFLGIDKVFTYGERMGLPSRWAVILLGALVVAIIVLVLYWFFGTEIGCAVRATGNNEKMIRAQGVNTDNTKILGLVISNGLVALSGALIAQQQNFVDIQMGTGAIVIGLASVIIGEVLFFKGNFLGRMVSIALGAVVYRIIIAMVIELGMNPTDLKLFTAITVALALSLPRMKKKLGMQPKPSGGMGGGGK